jgi:phage terminase Nu1 subunit (DNA packaging protein)
VIVKTALDHHHPGHDYSDADIEAHVAVTHSDEAIVEMNRQWLADQKARRDAEAAQWYAEDAARKASDKLQRDHQDRLAHEKRLTEAALEEAGKFERRSKTLEGQLSAVFKRQGK